MRTIPVGMHREFGSSRRLSAVRCFVTAAAHGRNGSPPFSAHPMSTNSWLTTMSLQPSRGHGRLSSGFQMPDRSGLPSAVRGAGAARSTAPAVVLGTPAVGYFTHCADSGTAVAITTAAAASARLMLEILDERGLSRRHE